MKPILNKCKTKDTLTLAEITAFASDIKNRTSHDIERLKDSMKENGFLFPIFVWKNHNVILDGKARYLALKQLKDEGFILDNIPVVFVDAKDEEEAKEKVLQVNSRYGKITEGSLNFFAKDCKINLNDLNIHMDKINFSFESKGDLVRKGNAMVIGGSAPQTSVPPIQPSMPSSSLQIGGSVSQHPTEDIFKGNDGSVEQTWADSQQSMETPQFGESFETASETAEPSPFEIFEPEEGVTSEEVTTVQNPSTPTTDKVPFTCPFCYSQFELTMEQIQEILAQ
ncbi:ParB-like nuclease domain-containing protein [Treponema bryantii]|uniref:ParB-like nuclease domain-containing protein n=1 Tax=Treponema bryantii TaxID=163 RepID=A0A1H9AWA2_9SPIR|nr:ParB N-terminal domain-containing protein [Treponema bryantii]SEP80805.1 ParB-like nuclease domain-containing protein [Treponema bryantii]